MATSVFRGFKIKGIDEERLPLEEERAPRPVRGGYRGRNMEVVEYPPYTVFILLESIRGSDDDPLPEIDSEIRRIWKKFFDEGSRSLERYHQEYLHQWQPDNALDEIRQIRLTYYDDGDCGQIRIVKTHLKEVEDLMNEPSGPEGHFRKLKPLLEWVNKKTLEELEQNIR